MKATTYKMSRSVSSPAGRYALLILLFILPSVSVTAMVAHGPGVTELLIQSELVVSGEVARLEEKNFVFKTDEILHGNLPGFSSGTALKIARFPELQSDRVVINGKENDRPSLRPNRKGQRAIVFLRRSKDDKDLWVVDGWSGAGWHPILNRRLFYNEYDVPASSNRAKVQLLESDLSNAIKEYRATFNLVSAGHGKSIRLVSDEDHVKLYEARSNAHRLLAQKSRRLMQDSWLYRGTPNKAIVVRNNEYVFEVSVATTQKPDRIVVHDSANLVAEVLVIARGTYYQEHDRANLGATHVEIYPLAKKSDSPIVHHDRGLASSLNGQQFTAPSKHWGVILHEAFGQKRILGFTFFRSDGTLLRRSLDQPIRWLNYGQAEVTDQALSIPALTDNESSGSRTLLINSKGETSLR